MTVYISDPDLTIHVGDVRDVLPTLPAESVDCVVTSPPYWGLRDYGTSAWEGGDPGCDHQRPERETRKFANSRGEGVDDRYAGTNLTSWTYRDATVKDGGCPKRCGARRVDSQLGLEATPDEYVANMVAVFGEVRRVLRSHGTCWVNLGDSYASAWACDRRNVVGSGSLENGKRDDRPNRLVGGLKEKDLVGIPWRVAFALQADGWYLRSDIIWSKPNPMPESVTDRPTKAHEYVFLLSKQPRYWFDQEAVREPHSPDGRLKTIHAHSTDNSHPNYDNVGNGNERWPNSGRNVRSVWEIATQPFEGAHFATFPQELVRRCLLAGCPEAVCGTCGKPRERIVERGELVGKNAGGNYAGRDIDPLVKRNGGTPGMAYENMTLGWSDCGHGNYQPGTVLDPFFGAGTTGLVARKHGRRTIAIELNEEYARMAAERLSQLSLLAELA